MYHLPQHVPCRLQPHLPRFHACNRLRNPLQPPLITSHHRICYPAGSNPCGVLLARLETEGLGWAPTLCNIAALTSLLLCVVLNSIITGAAHVTLCVL